MEGSQEVGLALSFDPCNDVGCPNPGLEVGTVLKITRYNPQLHEIPANPYQNFSLTIPDGTQPGEAQLISTRLYLIGVSYCAFCCLYKQLTINSFVSLGRPQPSARNKRRRC
jgi:hypothetical protein